MPSAPLDPIFYAAAVDMVGIVFFDRGGRVVQVLSRMLVPPTRTGQPAGLSSNGTLWALLDNASPCVGNSRRRSPISKPISPAALHYAPTQCGTEGRLWVLTDGRLMRGCHSTD